MDWLLWRALLVLLVTLPAIVANVSGYADAIGLAGLIWTFGVGIHYASCIEQLQPEGPTDGQAFILYGASLAWPLMILIRAALGNDKQFKATLAMVVFLGKVWRSLGGKE